MMKRPEIQQLIDLLQLEPLEGEGGLFRSTYRSQAKSGEKCAGSAIYYFLTADSFSHLHRLPSDELYHFYLGDPVELLELLPDGNGRKVILGQDLLAGQQVQYLVKAGCWQGSRLLSGGSYALLGTTMSPGYDDSDYEAGDATQLVKGYPQFAEEICRLCGTPSFW